MASPQVRFDDLCVLIPHDSLSTAPASPRIVTKTYQLWGAKTKGYSSDDDDLLDTGNCLLTIPCINFKVPSLSRKTKQPLYRHSTYQPAQSCLSHGGRTNRAHKLAQCALSGNEKSASQPTLHIPAMVHVSHPSTPSTSSSSTSHALHTSQRQLRHHNSSSQLLNKRLPLTVPLRDCCPDCVHSVEAALLDTYCENWSTGAVKRKHAFDPSEPTMKQVGCTIWANKMRRGRALARTEDATLLMAKRTLSDSSTADEDDEDLFPLPSPRRCLDGSPECLTPPYESGRQSSPPNASSLSAALNAKIASTTRTLSPMRPAAKIASTTRIAPRMLSPPPRHPSRMESPPPTGRELLALCPDVDELPPQTRGRSPSDVSTTSSSSATGLMGRRRSGSSASRGRERSESSSGMAMLSRERSNSSSMFPVGSALAKSVAW